MVQLAGLDLWICSERFEKISLSGYRKLDKTGTKGANKYLRMYATRSIESLELRTMSFLDWFIRFHSERGEREYVPHFPGKGTRPIYPITEYHARILLLIHMPWHMTSVFPTKDYSHQLRSFLQSKRCPRSLRITYERDKKTL
jgi:hypothetical protein